MSKQTLNIETTVKLDNTAITTQAIKRSIPVDCAYPQTVTVPKDAPGCEQCVIIDAGRLDRLRFLLLLPVPYIPKPATGTGTATPAQQPGQTAAKGGEPADDILKQGFKFYTSDSSGQRSDEIDLTGVQIYTDNQLKVLYKANDDGYLSKLEYITFINHTKYCVDVTIIQGKDSMPCKDGSEPCPPTKPSTAR